MSPIGYCLNLKFDLVVNEVSSSGFKDLMAARLEISENWITFSFVVVDGDPRELITDSVLIVKTMREPSDVKI